MIAINCGYMQAKNDLGELENKIIKMTVLIIHKKKLYNSCDT